MRGTPVRALSDDDGQKIVAFDTGLLRTKAAPGLSDNDGEKTDIRDWLDSKKKLLITSSQNIFIVKRNYLFFRCF